MPDPIRGVDTANSITPTTTVAAGSAQSANDADNVANAGTTTAPTADLADVGQTEALLQTILQTASNTPGIDQAKVSELQQAIASGAYQVNPQSIAQKLAELENQLGTAGQLQ